MTGIAVSIVRFVDMDPQPGIVECRFTDAAGREHVIVEKIPVITLEDLWIDSSYPRPGVMRCTVIERLASGVVIVDTSKPWAIETIDGQTRFEVLPELLVEDSHGSET